MKTKILETEADDWYLFCTHYPSMRVADLYPDLVRHVHVQIKLKGNFGLNGSVP